MSQAEPKRKLSRSNYRIVAGLPESITNHILYIAFEMEGRFENDRTRPYQLVIGMIETEDNMRIINELSQADERVSSVELATFNGSGDRVSWRKFSDLKHRHVSYGLSSMASHEQPVHKIIFDCALTATDYNRVPFDEL